MNSGLFMSFRRCSLDAVVCTYRCTFCEMYTSPEKQFRAKPLEEVERELAALAMEGGQPPLRVFLADVSDWEFHVAKYRPSTALTRQASGCHQLLQKNTNEYDAYCEATQNQSCTKPEDSHQRSVFSVRCDGWNIPYSISALLSSTDIISTKSLVL